jgi:hypothetical protein
MTGHHGCGTLVFGVTQQILTKSILSMVEGTMIWAISTNKPNKINKQSYLINKLLWHLPLAQG